MEPEVSACEVYLVNLLTILQSRVPRAPRGFLVTPYMPTYVPVFGALFGSHHMQREVGPRQVKWIEKPVE